MNETNTSEIARLREQIRLEYEASQRVFTDVTPTAKHQYITKRQENIGVCFERLSEILPPEEAIGVVAEILAGLQSSSASIKITSSHINPVNAVGRDD